jgi:hypothetical protein
MVVTDGLSASLYSRAVINDLLTLRRYPTAPTENSFEIGYHSCRRRSRNVDSLQLPTIGPMIEHYLRKKDSQRSKSHKIRIGMLDIRKRTARRRSSKLPSRTYLYLLIYRSSCKEDSQTAMPWFKTLKRSPLTLWLPSLLFGIEADVSWTHFYHPHNARKKDLNLFKQEEIISTDKLLSRRSILPTKLLLHMHRSLKVPHRRFHEPVKGRFLPNFWSDCQ